MELPSANNSPVVSPPPAADHDAHNAVVRRELDRLLSSPALRDSDQLKRFLRFIVERTLAGQGDQLKEYVLGIEVFDRDPSFDPKIDPVVRMAARRLRAKLEKHYEKDHYEKDHHENGGRGIALRIEVPKGSYAASFLTVDEPAAATGLAGDFSPLARPRPPAARRRWKFVTACALLVAVAATALYLRHARLVQVNAQPTTLAVLPFLNLTGNPDNDYLSDGITDEVTGEVATASGLRVVARTSAFQFKGKSVDVREIGRRLNASAVLEGSIQTQNDRLRITAQFIRAADGYHLWAKTYELPSKDTFAVEDEISRALAGALSARLSPQADSSAKRHPVDPAAHELYLRGQYMRQRLALDAVQKAMVYFNQALDRDPLYAEAYAALAAGYAVQGANAWAPAPEVYPKAKAAATRAIELDPNLPDAVAILANINFFYDWDFPAAEKGFRHALDLNPNSDKAHQWYGILLYYCKRFGEASEQFRLAKRLNPLAVQIDLTIMMLADAERNYDEAIALNRKILSENNNVIARMFLAWSYASKKQFKEAIDEGEKGIALAGDEPDANLFMANIYVQAGQREKAMSIVRKYLDRDSNGGFIPPYTMAGVYAELGDREQMYNWLDKCIERRAPAILKLKIGEPFDPYRSEPRFQEILGKTGLPR